MPFMTPCQLPALVLALVVGSGPMASAGAPPQAMLPAAEVAALKVQQPALSLQARATLIQARSQFGLDARADFVPRQITTNRQGRTVVRFQQRHNGLRVWGGQAIVHVEANGQVSTLAQGVQSSIDLATATPALDAAKAKAIALRSLAAKGPLGAAPKVELVVFPSRFTGGLATRFDPERHGQVLDRTLSTWAKAPAAPYVLAYQVKTLLANKQDGHKETNFIVDATTGAILRKWSALQGAEAGAVQGTGESFYRGTVPLSTTQAEDGTFSLRAQDRGTLPQPYVAEQGFTQIGLTTYYGYMETASGLLGFTPYEGHGGNTWGNGLLIPPAWDFVNGGVLWDTSLDGLSQYLQGALTPTGETTAVDAHFGLSASWDFYQNVFGRNGIDDLGSSTFSVVHSIEQGQMGPTPVFDNAYWAPWYFGMVFGDGTSPHQSYSWSLKAITELDVTGHEITHGVTEYSAGLIYSGLSGGLNEATSDMLGKMVQAYTDGGASGSVIPDFPAGDLTRWEIALKSSPSGSLRSMYKPSRDGYSADGWYDGIEMLDVHFNSGPPNRFFFFLCQGASATAGADTYSPYLPSGMAGIGNDKAARIWYKALTEYLVEDADFDAAREASHQAAEDLYGAGSPEAVAVLKAWAAVNVGEAPGQATRVRVSFPVTHPDDSFLGTNVVPSGLFAKVQLFPVKASVSLKCNVANTTNTKVTWDQPVWSTNGVSEVGRINADGTWTTPTFGFYYDLLDVKVTSQADPSQFAKARVLLVPADADTDNETDALDMGAAAMAWGLPATPNPAAWVAGSGDDWDLAFLGESLVNAFPVL